ncbi:MAG: DUF4126 domain-containing protein [Gemmatimonadetes bacterium]|nr:DUF4126 domain-containing protein [Gemmatimonadota bacterium]
MLDAILAGRLIGASLACGLNLYATFATLGIAGRSDWIDALPAPLRGLEHGLLIGTALVLLTMELALSLSRWAHSIWESAHTVVRPVGAAALTWMTLDALPLVPRVAAGLVAAALALGVHMVKLGLRVVLPGRRLHRVTATLAEAALAATLVMLVLLQPALAATAVAAMIVLLALLGPALARSAVFAARALVARLRGFFGTRGWRSPSEMPAALRALVAPRPTGSAILAARAALTNGRLRGAWRNGWLVIDDAGAAFLHRRMTRARRIPLETLPAASARAGVLADVVQVSGSGSPFTLHLLKDGPPVEAMLGALRTHAS